MSNSSVTERLVATAREQHFLVKNALEHCFDICLDGLNSTYNSVEELYDKDSYFFMRASHVKIKVRKSTQKVLFFTINSRF